MEGGVVLKGKGFWIRMILFVGRKSTIGTGTRKAEFPVVASLACRQHAHEGDSETDLEVQELSIGPTVWVPDGSVLGFSDPISNQGPFLATSDRLFAEELVEFSQCLFAELDGEEPLEAVILLEYHAEEGWRNCYLAAYSLEKLGSPYQIGCAHMRMTDTVRVGLETVDFNGDGIDEIIVFAGSDEPGAASGLGVYTLSEGRLKNAVRGFDSEAGYFDCDFGRGCLPAVVLLKVVRNEQSGRLQVVVLKEGESGYYLWTEVKASRRKPGYDASQLIQMAVTDAVRNFHVAWSSLKE
jgi:hypothetical protein